jgi:hypothetical protein
VFPAAGVIVSIRDFVPSDQAAVRSLILEGLAELWGTIDRALNTDVADIAVSSADGRTLVATVGGVIVGTGTIAQRSTTTAEIVRMSLVEPPAVEDWGAPW